jgi:hypothetical protein
MAARRAARSTRRAVGALVAVLVASAGIAVFPTAGPAGAADPTLSADPATNLTDGSVVELTGTGFPGGTTVAMAMCLGSATDAGGCDTSRFALSTTDASGTFVQTFGVSREISVPTAGTTVTYDCAQTACKLGASEISGVNPVGPVAFAPVSFAVPRLAVSIVPIGTLEPGTNLAVVQARVTCDVTTPVAVLATVTQPLSDPLQQGIQGTAAVPNELPSSRLTCPPTAPADVILPTRSFDYQHTDFADGPAAVGVDAQPFVSFLVGRETEHGSATVQLIDGAALRAAVLVALQDPANVELREQVLRAIQLQFAQDPVFRAEWIALLSH